jgi:adenosylhomocysteine nucleosidase
MRLGIVGALPGELQALTEKPVAAGVVVSLSPEVWLVLAGVGAERARVAGRLLLQHGATALLSWGCAGTLIDGLAPGSLLLPAQIITAEQAVLAVSRDWHEQLYRCLAGGFAMSTEPLVESPTVVADPAQKRALSARCGAVAVDMESAALGRLARETGVSFAVIRAIADTVDMTVPRWLSGTLDPWGRLKLSGLLRGLLLHPHEWLALARLARGFRAAQTTLADVADRAGILQGCN